LLFRFEDLKAAFAANQAIQEAGLNPVAADIVNPILTAQFGMKGFILAVQFAGNEAVIERCNRESTHLGGDGGNVRTLAHDEESQFWSNIAQITPRHLEKFREGAVVRITAPISECAEALGTVEGAGHAMAATGVVRAWFSRPEAALRWLSLAAKREWKGVVEFTGEDADRQGVNQWPAPGDDFAIMKKIKNMFDPERLLNPGRLFGLL
jgi:FAD/FMN-containing dehydrogenase